jgi:hypothetical protein
MNSPDDAAKIESSRALHYNPHCPLTERAAFYAHHPPYSHLIARPLIAGSLRRAKSSRRRKVILPKNN